MTDESRLKTATALMTALIQRDGLSALQHLDEVVRAADKLTHDTSESAHTKRLLARLPADARRDLAARVKKL